METASDNIFGDTFLASKWLNPDYLFREGVDFFKRVLNFSGPDIAVVASFYEGVLFIFALFFLTLISYTTIRLFEIRAKEHKHLKHEIAEYAHHERERAKKKEKEEAVSKNERWVKTLHYLFSQHPSDWKLAVIEADSMLESLLGTLGFQGETLGDKLKSADQKKFHKLTYAWEAHTIRNKIAHEGVTFALTQREAKRIIALYEEIFKEYGYI